MKNLSYDKQKILYSAIRHLGFSHDVSIHASRYGSSIQCFDSLLNRDNYSLRFNGFDVLLPFSTIPFVDDAFDYFAAHPEPSKGVKLGSLFLGSASKSAKVKKEVMSFSLETDLITVLDDVSLSQNRSRASLLRFIVKDYLEAL